MDYDEIYSEERINAMIKACLALRRGGKVSLYSIHDEVQEDELSQIVKEHTGAASPGHVEDIMYYIRAWMAFRLSDYASKDVIPEVGWRDFRDCLFSAVASACQNVLMNYSTAAFIDHHMVESQLTERPLYVEQMDWIGLPHELQKKAAMDFVKATINRDKWKEDDSIGKSDVEEFEARLKLGYENNCRIADHETRGQSPEEIGRARYGKCMDPAYCRSYRISNKEVNDGAVEGSLHMLANSGEIGWHPDWEEKAGKSGQRKGDI